MTSSAAVTRRWAPLRIFDKHEYTLKYVNEFGLELMPYDTGTRAFYMQGKRFLPRRRAALAARRVRAGRAA